MEPNGQCIQLRIQKIISEDLSSLFTIYKQTSHIYSLVEVNKASNSLVVVFWGDEGDYSLI